MSGKTKKKKKELKVSRSKQPDFQLEQRYNELFAKYSDLCIKYSALNDMYGEACQKNADILVSRTYKLSRFIKQVLDFLHLTNFFRFLLAVRSLGIKEAWNRRVAVSEVKKAAENNNLVELDPSDESDVAAELNSLKNHYQYMLAGEWDKDAYAIDELLNSRPHKGVAVYPKAVRWETIQRPQHFLRTLADDGYICFFCDDSVDSAFEEKYPGVFVVRSDGALLQALSGRCPIVLCTWYKHALFAEALPNRVIWFDVLDRLDFFTGGYAGICKTIYSGLLKSANIVSYSADSLLDYITGRPDALLLSNGVFVNDFADSCPAQYMKNLRASGRKIIGYYGAVEEWFDKAAISALLNNTDHEIVIIGSIGISLDDISSDRLHLLGKLPYAELKNYSSCFDLALIPFIKNELTDSVSPVKFFEYAASGIPVLSSDINEMRKYACGSVRLYHDADECVSIANEMLSSHADKQQLRQIAEENSWEAKVKKAISLLYSKPSALNALADFKTSSSVSALSVTFFEYDGSNYYSGGAERYLLDLHEICKNLNIKYRIYQYASYNWVRFYNNVEVIGIVPTKSDVNNYLASIDEVNSLFLRETGGNGVVNIYSPFYILSKKNSVPSIGISHGISWDSEYVSHTDGISFWNSNKNIIDSASMCDKMISVDTNTCNWFQTINYSTGRKIHYVPNYVDNSEFKPDDSKRSDDGRIIITYPRRLYGARGLYVVLDVIDDVLTKYSNVEFRFVGKGFEKDTNHVVKKIEKWGDRVKWYSRSPDKMYEVYQETDISLIPTMYSEGTSLSCLEALSSGNVVISTRIGGLTDLIMSGYNGILVEPTGDAIKEALFDLLDNPEKIPVLKENARKTSMAFSKSQWISRWEKAILSGAAERSTSEYEDVKRCLIYPSDSVSTDSEKFLSAITEKLSDGWYVYAVTKNTTDRFTSYKRLQYVKADEDLYFTPEEIIKVE